MTTNDNYVAAGNPDDGGTNKYSGTMHLLGQRYP